MSIIHIICSLQPYIRSSLNLMSSLTPPPPIVFPVQLSSCAVLYLFVQFITPFYPLIFLVIFSTCPPPEPLHYRSLFIRPSPHSPLSPPAPCVLHRNWWHHLQEWWHHDWHHHRGASPYICCWCCYVVPLYLRFVCNVHYNGMWVCSGNLFWSSSCALPWQPAGRDPQVDVLEKMVKESPGPLNFTLFLGLFGDKLKGKLPTSRQVKRKATIKWWFELLWKGRK